MSSASPASSSSKRKTPPEISEDEFTRIPTREEKRKQKKVAKHKPSFQYNIQDLRYGKKVTIAHIRDLLLYILVNAQKPQWIHVENKSFISHTVVLYIPGLLPAHLGLNPNVTKSSMPFSLSPDSAESTVEDLTQSTSSSKVPSMSELFTYGCPTRAPGDKTKMHSPINQLLMSPMPDSVKKQIDEETQRLHQSASTLGRHLPLMFLLTPNQMIDNNYSLPSYLPKGNSIVIPGSEKWQLPEQLMQKLSGSHDAPSIDSLSANSGAVAITNSAKSVKGNTRKGDWVETAEAQNPPDNGIYPVLAIDCEMVVSNDGDELARVSVVDFESGQTVFDHFVKPPLEITDYRTRWSGITADLLRTATHTVASIQQCLLLGETPIITPHTILLGHSLECDLNALRIRHPLCIDTALIYKHPRGPPFKPGLKWLAQKWLNKEIQASEEGHDSVEDAKACVDLLRMKMEYEGPEFGNSMNNMEPIVERLNRYTINSPKGKTSAYCDYGNPRWLYGNKATTAISCSDDEEVWTAVRQHVKSHDFVFARLMDLARVQGCKSHVLWFWDNGDPTLTVDSENTLEQALTRFDTLLTSLHSSLPPNTALILVTGHSSPLAMLDLTRRRQRWEQLIKTNGSLEGIEADDRWLTQDDRSLEQSVEEAKEGMAFFRVKT
nr:RNA exonuclease 1 [Cryptococcus depauperatus CBS 7841]